MALIVCPDCKKEVSNKATVCPSCGWPIDILPKIEYEVDNDSTYCKACLNCGRIYHNASAECYRKGYCIECRSKNHFDKLAKIDYTTMDYRRRVGDYPQYNSMRYQYRVNEYIKRKYGVERDLFEKYVKHWDTLDKECTEYKRNIKNLYENSVTVGENETRLSNETKSKINIGIFFALVVALILCFIMLFSSESSNGNGRCDICNKSKYSSINGEDYCYKHYKNAIDYYLDE